MIGVRGIFPLGGVGYLSDEVGRGEMAAWAKCSTDR